MNQVDEKQNMSFISIALQNYRQRQLDDSQRRIFDSSHHSDDLVEQLKAAFPTNMFISRKVQKNYEIYRAIRTELGSTEINVPEFHVTGPLISRQLITLLRDGKQKRKTLGEYNLILL